MQILRGRYRIPLCRYQERVNSEISSSIPSLISSLSSLYFALHLFKDERLSSCRPEVKARVKVSVPAQGDQVKGKEESAR